MPSYCRPQLEQTSQPGLLDRLCGLSEGHPVHLGAPQLGEGVTLPQLTYDGGRVGVQSDVVDVEQPGRGQSVGVDGDPTRFLGRRGLDCRQDVTSLLPWPYSAAPSAAAQWSEASRWSSANGESSPGEGSRPKSATGRLLPPRPSTGTTISRSPSSGPPSTPLSSVRGGRAGARTHCRRRSAPGSVRRGVGRWR